MTSWDCQPLEDHHKTLLEASAITPEVAHRHSLYSAFSPDYLPTGVNSPAPALCFKWTAPDGRVEWQARPDSPETDEDGRPRKYVFRRGADTLLWAVKDGSGPVWIVEGTKQSLAAASWAPDDVAVYGISGCRGWSKNGQPIPDLSVVADRDVVVIFDADAVSNRHVYDAGVKLREALEVEGADSVKFARLPGAKETGLDDLLGARPAEGRTAWLERIVAKAKAKPADRQPPVNAKLTPAAGRPTVVVNDDRLKVITDITAHLKAAGDGQWLFDHGGALSRLVDTELEVVSEGRFHHMLPHVVRTVAEGANGYRDALPEAAMVRAVLTAAEAFTPIERVTRNPFLRDDGSVCQAAGYDPDSKTLLVPSPGFAELIVPEDPTEDEIRSARKLLVDEWLGDFPFDGDSSRANALALVLTPFVRGLVPKVPLAVVDGLQMGVGKNLLADCLSILVTGEMADPKSYSYDEDEQRKSITSAFQGGGDLFIWDEAHVLKGNALARALTSAVYSDRILGQSVMVKIPNRVTWVSLGNNVQLVGDMVRRVYRIRLAPTVEDPYDRPESSFRHPDLTGWTTANRPELVAAALTLIRAWFAADRPPSVRGGSFGSFEPWGRMLGGIVDLAGQPGFLEGTHEWRSESDQEGDAWGIHLRWLARTFGDKPFTSRQVKDAAITDSNEFEAPLGLDNVMDRGWPKQLGHYYSRMLGREMSGYILGKSGRSQNHVAFWRVSPSKKSFVDGSMGSYGDQVQPIRTAIRTPSGSPDENVREETGPKSSPCFPLPLSGDLSGPVAFDIETGDSRLLHTYGDGFVRLVGHTLPDASIALTTDAADFTRRLPDADLIIGHNVMSFDLVALARHHGLDLPALTDRGAVFDTLLAARHLDPPSARMKNRKHYDLDALGEKFGLGGKNGDLKAMAKAHGGYDKIPTDDPDYRAYLAQDVRLSAGVALELLPAMDAYLTREHKVAAIAAQLGLNGWRIDTDLLARRCREGDDRKHAALLRLVELYPDIPTTSSNGEPYKSPLATEGGKIALEAVLTASGVPAHEIPRTDKTGLLQTTSEAMAKVKTLMGSERGDIATLCDLISTVVGERTIYHTIANHTHDGRIYPGVSMDQSTGRWSVTRPGLTVVGKRGGRHVERDVFLPDPGHVLVTVDLSQVDARAVAAHCQDPAYMALFAPGRDLHAEIAARVWGDPGRREEAKAIGHGWNYGMGIERLGATTGLGRLAAEQFDQAMSHAFPKLVAWKRDVAAQAESGELLDNGFGRKMRPDPQRAHTQGPAFMGQGTARDLMMEGLLRLPREAYPYLRGVVHDEVVLSVPVELADDVERTVVQAMTFPWHDVDIVAEPGKRGATWGACYVKG